MEEKLIHLVSGYKCLWDKRNKGYQDKLMRENAWRSIAAAINTEGITDAECMAKWKYLRSKFTTALEESQNNARSGSAGGKKKAFPHMEIMKFLTQHIKKRSTWTKDSPSSPTRFSQPTRTERSKCTSTIVSGSLQTSQPVDIQISSDRMDTSEQTQYFSNFRDDFVMSSLQQFDSSQSSVDHDCTQYEFLEDSVEQVSTPVPKKDRTTQKPKSRKFNSKKSFDVGSEFVENAMSAVVKAADSISNRNKNSDTPTPVVEPSMLEIINWGQTITSLLHDLPSKEKYAFMRDTTYNLLTLKMELNKNNITNEESN